MEPNPYESPQTPPRQVTLWRLWNRLRWRITMMEMFVLLIICAILVSLILTPGVSSGPHPHRFRTIPVEPTAPR